MALWKMLGCHTGEGDSGSWRDLLSYYSVWCKALIGTCQVSGRPSGIALTLVEVMDIRKSSHCGGGGGGVGGGIDRTGKRQPEEEKQTEPQGHETAAEQHYN